MLILDFTLNINSSGAEKSIQINETVLLGLVVFKLDMETILNAHFHFNGGVEFRVGAQCVDDNVQLFADVIESSDHCGSKEISARRHCHM